MMGHKLLIWIFIILICCHFLASPVSGAKIDTKMGIGIGVNKVSDKQYFVHIMSYGMDIESDKLLNDGIRSAMAANPASELFSVSLDANKGELTTARLDAIADLLYATFSLNPPEVIIVSDYYAMEFVRDYYEGLFNGVPVIYFGLEYALSGEENSFSFLEEGLIYCLFDGIYAKKTVNQMLQIFPHTKKLFVINDFLADGRTSQSLISAELEIYVEEGIDIEYNDDLSLQNLLNKLNALSDDTLVLVGQYNADIEGSFYSSSEINALFDKNCVVPMFCLNMGSIGNGQIGGFMVDRFNSGLLIGNYVIDLAFGVETDHGKYIDYFQSNLNDGVEGNTGTDGQRLFNWIFDWASLDAWNISERRLPEGALILNREPTVSKLSTVYIFVLVAALSVVAVLIATVYVLVRRYGKLSEMLKNFISINEFLEHEAEINEVNGRLMTTMESAPLAYVLILEDGFVIESNTYSQNEIGIVPGEKIQNFYINPSYHIMVLNKLKGKDTLQGEILKLKTQRGDIDRFHLNFALSEHGGKKAVLIWGINIENSELQKDSLNRSQEDLQKVIDALPIPMQIIDYTDIRLLYGNKAYFNMLKLNGRMPGNIDLYQSLPETQPDGESSISFFSRFLNDVMRSNVSLTRDVVYLTTAGEKIETRMTCMSLLYMGEPAMVVILQDITAERRQAQMLKNTAEKEKEANQLKNRFIVNMSHEIRTPMNAIIGLTEIELVKPHDKDTREKFEKINLSAKILLNIINDILDFSKIEAQKLDIVDELFALRESVAGALFMVSQRLADKRVELLTNVDYNNIPEYVYGDKTRTWQVIKNVLDNSAKFTDYGSIMLEITAIWQTELRNGESDKGNDGKGNRENSSDIVKVVYKITDTGRGISEENLKRLYVPFEQFSDSTNQTGGTGLGLSITKQLIELMGGEIFVESELNSGTSTTIIIPYKNDKNPVKLKDKLGTMGLDSIMALIISDNDRYAEPLESCLKCTKMEITRVSGAEQALLEIERTEKAGTAYDLIIVDDFIDGFYHGNDKDDTPVSMERESCIDIAQTVRTRLPGVKLMLAASPYAVSVLHVGNERLSDYFDDIMDKPIVSTDTVEKIARLMEVETEKQTNGSFVKFSGANVLLCEDNVINQEVASGMLSMFGIEPVIADDGKEALDYLENQEFDLIFLDILMPVMDGHETALAIRHSAKPYRDVPIVAMTANVMKDEVAKCLSEGMNGHISKPIEFSGLLEHLKKWIPTRKQTPTPAGSKMIATDLLREDLLREELLRDMAEISEIEYSGEFVVDIDDKEKLEKMAIEIEAAVSGIGEINYSEGLRRFGGKKDRYLGSLYKFALSLDANPFSDFLSDFDKHAGDVEEARKAAHTLKGTAGNLSIYTIYNAATEYEGLLKNSILDKKSYLVLADSCADVKTRLLRMLKRDGSISTGSLPAGSLPAGSLPTSSMTANSAAVSKPAVSKSELIALLRELIVYLEMSDAKMCDEAAAKLKSMKKDGIEGVDAEKIHGICEHIEGYAYDEAIGLINSLLG